MNSLLQMKIGEKMKLSPEIYKKLDLVMKVPHILCHFFEKKLIPFPKWNVI